MTFREARFIDAIRTHVVKEKVGDDGTIRRRAICPSCDSGRKKKGQDRLIVTTEFDGRVLVHCLGMDGCTAETITAAVGCTIADLYPIGYGAGCFGYRECPKLLKHALSEYRMAARAALAEKALKPCAALMLQALANEAEQQGSLTPRVANSTWAFLAGVGESTLHRHRRALVSAGWLGIHEPGGTFSRSDGLDLVSNRYHLGDRHVYHGLSALVEGVDHLAPPAVAGFSLFSTVLARVPGGLDAFSAREFLSKAADQIAGQGDESLAQASASGLQCSEAGSGPALAAERPPIVVTSSMSNGPALTPRFMSGDSFIPIGSDLARGLGPTRTMLVNLVAEHGSPDAASLAKLTGMTARSVSRHMNGRSDEMGRVSGGLVSAGLINRSQDSTGRHVFSLADDTVTHQEWATRFRFDGLTEERRREITHRSESIDLILDRVAAARQRRGYVPSRGSLTIAHMARLALGRNRLVEDDEPLWEALMKRADADLCPILLSLRRQGAALELSEKLGSLWIVEPEGKQPGMPLRFAGGLTHRLRDLLAEVGGDLIREWQSAQARRIRAEIRVGSHTADSIAASDDRRACNESDRHYVAPAMSDPLPEHRRQLMSALTVAEAIEIEALQVIRNSRSPSKSRRRAA